jgi:hypothetical protein
MPGKKLTPTLARIDHQRCAAAGCDRRSALVDRLVIFQRVGVPQPISEARRVGVKRSCSEIGRLAGRSTGLRAGIEAVQFLWRGDRPINIWHLAPPGAAVATDIADHYRAFVQAPAAKHAFIDAPASLAAMATDDCGAWEVAAAASPAASRA